MEVAVNPILPQWIERETLRSEFEDFPQGQTKKAKIRKYLTAIQNFHSNPLNDQWISEAFTIVESNFKN
jgi:hypothetical protein